MRQPVPTSPAVYLIRCNRTAKVYVGSSVNPRLRWYLHLDHLRRGRHHSPHLQRAFNKHGERSFGLTIAEFVSDLLFLRAREQFWIWRKEGRLYNVSRDAFSAIGEGGKMSQIELERHRSRMIGNTYRRGTVMAEEARRAISVSLIGNQHRRGTSHDNASKAKISASLQRAIREGRRPVGHLPLIEFGKRIAAGEIPSPWVKQSRNDVMVQRRLAGEAFTRIARDFGLDPSGVRKTILGPMKRMGASA